MYSPKIREDLIPIIYRESKIISKTMTKYIDDLIRPLLMENKNLRVNDNDENKISESENDSDDMIEIDDNDKVDIEEISYCCSSCRMKVNETDGEKGVCENCECEVFVEKL